jgi:hypothetical protein
LLRATLEEFIDFERIRHSPVKLFLTATNVSTGAVEVFDYRVSRRPERQKSENHWSWNSVPLSPAR